MTRYTVLTSVAAASLVGAVMAASSGCTDNDDRRRRDRVSRSDRGSRDARPGLARIPAGADRIERGKGKWEHEFERDGTLYVYDRTDDRVIYDERVRRDDRFEFDPDDDEMRLNGDRVGGDDLNLRAKHEYEIYFDD